MFVMYSERCDRYLTIGTARSPKRTARRDKNTIENFILKGTSTASSAFLLLERDRNVMPKALTKHAAASPPVNAREAAAIPRKILKKPELLRAPRKSACRVSHSLTNPFNGGRAEIAMEPIRKQAAVYGIFFISPPSFSISNDRDRRLKIR